MIIIIDYNLGNLDSVRRAVSHLGYSVEISDQPDEISQASHLILPGVGAFGEGMTHLKEKNLIPPIKEALDKGAALMGICLGMQLIMSRSVELGNHEGLDLIRGDVEYFKDQPGFSSDYKIPQIGWNSIYKTDDTIQSGHDILVDVSDGSDMYFVHSLVVKPQNPESIVATSDYANIRYCSVVRQGRIYGCQFHPEKSGEIGLKILKRFLST